MESRQRWPAPVLRAFTARMGGLGFSVSATLMDYDQQYALDQLRYAHTLADATLRELAVQLFQYFERESPGLGSSVRAT